MPSHTSRLPRRRRPLRRRTNPNRRAALIAAASVTAAGLVGYGGYRLSKALRGGPRPLPGSTQGGGGPGPLPGSTQGGGGSVQCDLGPNYPGFVSDGTGACSPTAATPPGIYVDSTCQDFTFVAGDDGDQVARFESMIETARVASLQPEAQSADPTKVVTQFLAMTWPQCTWPPTANATPRIAQLFVVLSLLVGRLIIKNGGRVLGTSAADLVDEQVAERLGELGLPEYEPDVVPEIKLPIVPIIVYPYFPPKPPGPDIDEPDPEGGKIELPPGGQQIPSQQGDKGPPDCSVLAQIRTITRALQPANFATERDETFKIWTPTSDQCSEYVVAFGVCLVPVAISFGFLDPYVSDNKPADVGAVLFRLRQADGSDIDWADFETPVVYKAQFKTTVRVAANGNISLVGVPGAQLSSIENSDLDPCSNKTPRWPVPSATFFQAQATDGGWKNWRAVPRFDVKTQGKNLMLRVRYSGLPRFARWDDNTQSIGGIGFNALLDALGPPQGQGEGIARLDSKTPLSLTVKVWSGGKE